MGQRYTPKTMITESQLSLLHAAMINYIPKIRERHNSMEEKIKVELPLPENVRRINQDRGLLLGFIKELLDKI